MFCQSASGMARAFPCTTGQREESSDTGKLVQEVGESGGRMAERGQEGGTRWQWGEGGWNGASVGVRKEWIGSAKGVGCLGKGINVHKGNPEGNPATSLHPHPPGRM